MYVREVCPIATIQIPRLDPVIQEAKRSVFMLLLISYESSVVEHSAALFDLLEARHSETTNNSCEPQQKPTRVKYEDEDAGSPPDEGVKLDCSADSGGIILLDLFEDKSFR